MGSMEISIEPIGTETTGALFDSALELHRILTAERDPALDPDTEGLFRGSLRGTDTFEVQGLVATENGSVVGMATIETHHLQSNSDKAEVEIDVHPERRRRGIGTRLVKAVVDVLEPQGRTVITEINVDGEQTRGFWKAMGAEHKLIERQSRLWLADTDEALMTKWVQQRDARAGEYRLEHWRGPTPDHLLPAAVQLMSAMNDAPLDGLDWEDEIWTEANVLELDNLIIGRGRERWVTMALGPNDEPAGMTAISIQPEKRRFAYQGNTAVDPVHRNRGIGRWLKADMWLRTRRDAPYVEAIDTDNAASNDAMLAINVAMGFTPLIDWSFWQADAATLRAHAQ